VQVVAEQAGRDFLQRPRGRGNLGDHVRALGISLDHFLKAADLTLDLAEPPQVAVLPGGVPGNDARARPGARRGIAPRRLLVGRGQQIAQPPVLGGVDLPAGQPLVQDPAGAAASSSSRSRDGRRAAVISAYTAQISRPQNTIIPTHIRLTCQNAQWAPYQNIISITSNGPTS
jgi:hypothetical protein